MKIVIALLFVSFAGCQADPVSTESTDNANVPVDLLFEHEGCKVYRFSDGGRSRYYANCPNATTVSSTYTSQCGKTQCTHDESIVTGYGATP